jgi:hypothetical protein
MTEEVIKVEGEQSPPEDKAPEFTEIEQRALEMGWRPQTEFHGEPVDFIDAKEFVSRKPLFDKIEKQSKELKNVNKALEALKVHYTKVQETEYNRALAKLQTARQEAITNSDGASFDAIDSEIKRVEGEMQSVKQMQAQPLVVEQEVHPEFAAWQHRNQWYSDNNQDMKDWADAAGIRLARQGLNPKEVLIKLEQDVKKSFPHKFTNPNKTSAPSVEDGKQTGSKSGASDKFELTEQESKIMNTLIRSDPKLFTREKYIAELKAAKGIK